MPPNEEGAPLLDDGAPTYYDGVPVKPRRKLRRGIRALAATTLLGAAFMIHGTSRTTELDALTTTTEVLKDEPLDWGLGL